MIRAALTRLVTRPRCALILLLALTWNLAGPWFGIGEAEAVRVTVITSEAAPEQGATWLPNAAGGEQLARLAGYQAGLPAPAALVVGRLAVPPTGRRGAPPPSVRPIHPRPHTLRSADDRDEPS